MMATSTNLGLSILGHAVWPLKVLGQWTTWAVTNGIRATSSPVVREVDALEKAGGHG